MARELIEYRTGGTAQGRQMPTQAFRAGTRPKPSEATVIFGYSIIGAILVGLILGVIAKLVMPGKQAVPLWLTILVGIVAAVIGNYVATLLGVGETFGYDWTRHALQLLFAVLGVGVLAGVYARKA